MDEETKKKTLDEIKANLKPNERMAVVNQGSKLVVPQQAEEIRQATLKAIRDKKRDEFLKEYNELVKKHRVGIRMTLRVGNDGILPGMQIVHADTTKEVENLIVNIIT